MLKSKKVLRKIKELRWKLIKDDKWHFHYEKRFKFIPTRWWK